MNARRLSINLFRIGVANQHVANHRNICLYATLLVMSASASVFATTDFKRGDPAPPIDLHDISGVRVNTMEMPDRAHLLIFGATDHDKTQRACAALSAVFDDPELRKEKIAWLLILSKSSRPKQPYSREALSNPPSHVLHDADRRVFGAYRVMVLPTAVITDPKGKVVHVLAGYSPRFADTVRDALLLAIGSIPEDEFDRRLHPQAATENNDHRLRAERLVKLAEQLRERNMDRMAETKYEEALALIPEFAPACSGLGALYVKQGKPTQAKTLFEIVRKADPDNPEALLGLALIHVARGNRGDRGGDELKTAEQYCRKVLKKHPANSRAHYLLGAVYESRGDLPAAILAFRKAAALCLNIVLPDFSTMGEPEEDESQEP